MDYELNVGDNVVVDKSSWVPGKIVNIENDLYNIKIGDTEEKFQKSKIRLSVLVKCGEVWARRYIIKKDQNQYLVNQKCDTEHSTSDEPQLIDLDNIYVFEKAEDLIKGNDYLIGSGDVWKKEKYEDQTDVYVFKQWKPPKPEKSEFLKVLKSHLSEDHFNDALKLIKKILFPDRIVNFKGSEYKIDDKSYDELKDKDLLNISEMIITYLYSKIKINNKISYSKSKNHFSIKSSKINKIIKVTNETHDFVSEDDLSDISEDDLSDISEDDLSDISEDDLSNI